MKQIEYKKVKEIYGVYILTDPIDGAWNSGLINKQLCSTQSFNFPIQVEGTGTIKETPEGVWMLYYISVRCFEDFKKFLGRLGEITEIETI